MSLIFNMFALIVFGVNGSTVATQEFRSELACLEAKEAVMEMQFPRSNVRYTAICVPLDVKEAK